jgi:hypothetical protein
MGSQRSCGCFGACFESGCARGCQRCRARGWEKRRTRSCKWRRARGCERHGAKYCERRRARDYERHGARGCGRRRGRQGLRQDNMVKLLKLKLRLRLSGNGLSLCFLMVPLLVTRSAADNAAFGTSFTTEWIPRPVNACFSKC